LNTDDWEIPETGEFHIDSNRVVTHPFGLLTLKLEALRSSKKCVIMYESTQYDIT